MRGLGMNSTVGEIVAERPALSGTFERLGIDYCCGGRKTLEEACRERGLDARTVLATLDAAGPEGREDGTPADAAAMSLSELADHIERTHHVYLRRELPSLDAMTEKVASVHGERDSRLLRVRDTFLALAGELSSHMMKEERILFPMIRQLEEEREATVFHCGTLAGPIGQMELEHEEAGSALERLRQLTDGFSPPGWACDTYRALLEALRRLEDDLHQHIHKENNVLFPRALEMEARKRQVPG